MKVIKPPQEIPKERKLLFLAGSIEMGEAQDWQAEVAKRLENTDWTILNPRRNDWDKTWTQSKDNPVFREQVEWELQGLESANRVLMYLDPATKSPISLMELGLLARDGAKTTIVCPQGFWRKGNVDIFCQRYSLYQTDTLEEAVNRLL